MADTDIQFSTNFNYQKIAAEGETTAAVPTPFVAPFTDRYEVPVTHNVGQITSFRAWYYATDVGKRLPVQGFYNNTISTIAVSAYLTTNELVFIVANGSGSTANVTFYWRVYYDAD